MSFYFNLAPIKGANFVSILLSHIFLFPSPIYSIGSQCNLFWPVVSYSYFITTQFVEFFSLSSPLTYFISYEVIVFRTSILNLRIARKYTLLVHFDGSETAGTEASF